MQDVRVPAACSSRMQRTAPAWQARVAARRRTHLEVAAVEVQRRQAQLVLQAVAQGAVLHHERVLVAAAVRAVKQDARRQRAARALAHAPRACVMRRVIRRVGRRCLHAAAGACMLLLHCHAVRSRASQPLAGLP